MRRGQAKHMVGLVVAGVLSSLVTAAIVELLTKRRLARESAPLPAPVAPGHGSV